MQTFLKFGWIVGLGVLIFGAGEAWADDVELLKKEVKKLKTRLEVLEKSRDTKPPSTPEKEEDDDTVEIRPPWDRDELDKPRGLRGVYDKPFLANLWNKAYVGGYAELEYHGFMTDDLGIPQGFRLHRANIFAFSDVTDRVRFGAEFEFENEEPGDDLEVALEMAFIDWVIAEEFVIRGGAILSPLGRININHDGPVRELTDRPLVSTFVIPTTMTEAGIGITGTIEFDETYSMLYEAYLTNGFQILDRNGNIPVAIPDLHKIMREGRPSAAGDTGVNPAASGRVAFQVAESFEIGGSWHIGNYDERDDNVLSLIAADMTLDYDLSEMVDGWNLGLVAEGEFAWAGFERDSFARVAGIPDRFWGFYFQAGVSFLPEAIRDSIPYIFDDENAAFTAVVRYDYVDLDGDRGEALEPGFNFRPFADTVFKLSYRFGFKTVGQPNLPGKERFDDEGFVFGLSTYF